MIISVHLPKTAGTSFLEALKTRFGNRLSMDSEDLPEHTPVFDRNRDCLQKALRLATMDFGRTSCIHGHFLPAKYLLLASRKSLLFVTWMRHPVDRVLSQYFFWKGSYDPEYAPSLHKQMMEQRWTVERFCLGPEVKNLYTQYLWAFPLSNFAFIGITEHYEEDLSALSKILAGPELLVFQKRVGASRDGKYPIGPALRQRIEAHHHLDMTLYRRALQLRQSRASQ